MSQTTEIQIQNQNGLSFRTKLNQMLSALNTVFSGTTAPTITEADMLWMDTSVTPNVLRRRNSSNTAWEICPIVEGVTTAATAKTTPVDADVFPLADSAASFGLKKLSWSNFKATLKTYFDTQYLALTGGSLTGNLSTTGTVTATNLVYLTGAQSIGGVKTWTAAQRGSVVTDNDLTFDLSAGNNFLCTPTAPGTLTFTNHVSGQSGLILLDNSGGHTLSKAATTKSSATFLSTISTAGVYLLTYFDNGTNAYLVSSEALT